MTANGKRRIQVESFSNNSSKQFWIMNKNLRETTNLCVEIMNSKRQVEGGKLGHVVQICVYLTRRKRDA